MVEGEAAGNNVERSVGERRLIDVTGAPFDVVEPVPLREAARLFEHGRGRVEADDMPDALRQRASHSSGATREVDRSVVPLRLRCVDDERDNIVGVEFWSGGKAKGCRLNWSWIARSCASVFSGVIGCSDREMENGCAPASGRSDKSQRFADRDDAGRLWASKASVNTATPLGNSLIPCRRFARCDRYCSASECRLLGEQRKCLHGAQTDVNDPIRTVGRRCSCLSLPSTSHSTRCTPASRNHRKPLCGIERTRASF